MISLTLAPSYQILVEDRVFWARGKVPVNTTVDFISYIPVNIYCQGITGRISSQTITGQMLLLKDHDRQENPYYCLETYSEPSQRSKMELFRENT